MQGAIEPAGARYESVLSLLEETVIRQLPPARSAAPGVAEES